MLYIYYMYLQLVSSVKMNLQSQWCLQTYHVFYNFTEILFINYWCSVFVFYISVLMSIGTADCLTMFILFLLMSGDVHPYPGPDTSNPSESNSNRVL